jgi:hypothetical protein
VSACLSASLSVYLLSIYICADKCVSFFVCLFPLYYFGFYYSKIGFCFFLQLADDFVGAVVDEAEKGIVQTNEPVGKVCLWVCMYVC